MKNKKIFVPRSFNKELIENIFKLYDKKGAIFASKKMGISISSIYKYVRMRKEGYKLENFEFSKKRVYIKKKILKNSNSKYTYKYKKNIIKIYKQYGFTFTLRRENIPETTLLRWIKKEKEGTLKHKLVKHSSLVPSLDYIARYTRNTLIKNNQLLPMEISETILHRLSNLGKFRYINSMREIKVFTVTYLCEVAKVSREAYYKWRRNGEKKVPKHNIKLADFIRSIKNSSNNYWGSRRIQQEYIFKYEEKVSRATVTRVMNIVGYVCIAKKKLLRNMNMNNMPAKDRKNLLREPVYKTLMSKANSLTTRKSNVVWYVDAHFIFTHTDKRGKLEIISILDSYDRSIVDFEFTYGKDHTNIYLKLIRRALKRAGTPIIVHSDNGSEFINTKIINEYKKSGIQPSFIKPYCPTQNGMIERFHLTLKQENQYYKKYKNINDAISAITIYIDEYNNKRPHSSLSNKTPQQIRNLSLNTINKIEDGIIQACINYADTGIFHN